MTVTSVRFGDQICFLPQHRELEDNDHEISKGIVQTLKGSKIPGVPFPRHTLQRAISLTGNFSKGRLTISGASAEPHVVHVVGAANIAADGSLAGSISVEQMEMNFTAVRGSGK